MAGFHRLDASSSATETLKLRAQPVFQAAHDLPLIFERCAASMRKFEGEKGDHEAVASGQWLVVSKNVSGRDFTGH